MRLILGSDHAGYVLRRLLTQKAMSLGLDTREVGAMSEEPYDYPDASDLVAEAIRAGEADAGVLVCGTGIGVSIRANRYRGIRAAVCCSPESARLARAHNHANVLCLGARLTESETALAILSVFLDSPEDDNERHVRRVEKLDGNVG